MRLWCSLVIAVLMLVACGEARLKQEIPTVESAFDLEEARWNLRPVLVFSPSGEYPDFLRQEELLAIDADGLAERDVRVVRVLGDSDAALRARYRAPMEAFTVILIGKDGGEKLRSGEPVTTGELFALIDTMPMRQQEMRRR